MSRMLSDDSAFWLAENFLHVYFKSLHCSYKNVTSNTMKDRINDY